MSKQGYFEDGAATVNKPSITTFLESHNRYVNKNRIPVILDVDDVLLDWSTGFRTYVSWKYQAKPVKDQPDSWHLSEYFGVSSEVVHQWVRDFNSSSHFSLLAVLPGAQHAIAEFVKGDHPLIAVSSCWGNMYTPILRQTNLLHHFGNAFSEIICLPLGADKQPCLTGIDEGVWVEDNYTNALAGHQVGHKTFMMRRSHNRSLESGSIPEIEWIDSWKPVIDYVRESRLR